MFLSDKISYTERYCEFIFRQKTQNDKISEVRKQSRKQKYMQMSDNGRKMRIL